MPLPIVFPIEGIQTSEAAGTPHAFDDKIFDFSKWYVVQPADEKTVNNWNIA